MAGATRRWRYRRACGRELTGDRSRRRRQPAAERPAADLPWHCCAECTRRDTARLGAACRRGGAGARPVAPAAGAEADRGGGTLDADRRDGRYAFYLDGGEPRADPRALRLPNGLHGGRRSFDTAHLHLDRRRLGREAPLKGAVIYEMHVGTFTAEGTSTRQSSSSIMSSTSGWTWSSCMPLASFPGAHGWGYDGVAPYSVHEAYGGPAALQRFVDAAPRPRARRLAGRGLQPPRTRRQLPAAVRPLLHRPAPDALGGGGQPRRTRQR